MAVTRRKIMNPTDIKNETTHPHHSRKRALWLLLAIPAALAAGFGAFQAHAAGGGFGFGPGAFGPGGAPEQHKAFMERRLEKALDAVNATDSQRTAINAIFERMFAEMRPVHQQHRQLHDKITSAFAAPNLDRAAIEQLRVQVTGLVDQGSQIFSKALLDAAQVLTADQRQTLVKYMQEMHGRGHGHGRF
jgi:periplasmic protein CpxP/Spy